ncbi:MAG: glycosyltransferase family 39 protein [Myxococcota bacterium]
MERTRRQGRLLAVAVLAAAAALILMRLSAFGILDPWELSTADRARDIASGEAEPARGQPPLVSLLVAAGFALFGVSEWAGRLPIAVLGVLALGVIHWLVARFGGWRTGIYAVVVAATTPLFMLNARQMLGQTPAFLAEAAVGLTAASAVFLPTVDADAPRVRRVRATWAWLAGLGLAAGVAVLARGALIGVLPPLAAVAVAAGASGALTHPDVRRSGAAWAITAAAAFVALAVLQQVAVDAADYSAWLGGRPTGGDPPTFDVVLEDVFHAFAPWSALALPAFGWMLMPREGVEGHLRRVTVLWAAFSYGALTLYLSRYGIATWVAVAPVAAAVAFLLRDVERSERSWWPVAVLALLFVGLLVRDYGLYPGSPVHSLAIERASVPDELNPITAWGVAFGLFGAVILVSLGSTPATGRPDFRAPYRLLRAQWAKGWRFRPWLLGGAVVAVAILVLGIAGAVAPVELGLATIVRKWTGRLALLLALLPTLVAGAQGLWWAMGRIARARAVPVLLAGAVSGGYAAHGYLPALSAHYSPRGVYDVYARLAEDGEPLGEYRVGNRAATYYVKGELHELENEQALVRFLAQGDGRRWAVVPADELPALDRRFRQRAGRHLYVADATSARVVLAASRPVEGHPNENPFAEHVLDEAPDVQHPVGAVYAHKIELIGYDLELPRDGHVGAGERFTLRWYWRSIDRAPGGWKVFVHIDGFGLRILGDHEPVDGAYPVRLWEKGDVIVDEQELTVPAHFRPGDYRIMVGFWMGDDRLEVVEGPQGGDDRVRAGVLRVR